MALSLLAYSKTRKIPVRNGVRGPLLAAGRTALRPWLQADRRGSEIWWLGQSITPLISSGPVGAKLSIAVVGDGFAEQDQDVYDDAVDELLVKGMFGHDFFVANRSAFNVHRINLVSVDSGVSTKTYDSNGNVTAQVDRHTPLNLYYSGSWDHCWLEGGPHHEERLDRALDLWLPDYHYVLVVLNNPGYGGCGGGGLAYVPLGVGWEVVAHEFGHAFGLGDEYCSPQAWTDGEPGAPNITANTNRSTLKWRHHVAATTPIPSGTGTCVGWTAGTKPPTWDDNLSVGLFEGAGTYNTGLYRPAIRCRMRTNTPLFCPVCAQSLSAQLAPYHASAVPAKGEENVMSAGTDGYVRMVVHCEDGALTIVDAREVEGPLAQDATVTSGLVHEVRVGDRRVALGAMPDVNVNRGFEPVGPEGPRVHHLYERDTFDFIVRVPRAQLRGADPAALSIDVVDVRTGQPQQVTGRGRLTGDASLQARQVATTADLSAGDLPGALRRVMDTTS